MLDIHWYIVFAAFILDFIFGDPKWLPHPIIYMGKAIHLLEVKFRNLIKHPFVSGCIFAVFLILVTWSISSSIIELSHLIHPFFGMLTEVILLFFCFSSKSLEKAGLEVYRPLKENDIVQARKNVSMIVGRETSTLSKNGVTRAGIETVAENFVDGVLSPLFFALIGGAPLALAYKMINTLDSMVGYRNEKYMLFGRASARIDDAANFIPARCSVLVISLGMCIFSVKKGLRALKTGLSQGAEHKSPNAGYPEACFAGALGVRLGGPNVYHGKVVDKPFIGKEFENPEPENLKQACDLMMLSSFLATVFSCFVLFI